MSSPSLLVAVAAVYLLALAAVGVWARRRVRSAEDFLVAGRRLPLLLSTATLFATWFGAGTLLTVSDEVRAHGLQATALDPLGAGLCLLLAGRLIARPLWELRLATLSDFYRVRFGRRAERLSAAILVPGYFGWIAAQFLALAHLLELIAGVPIATGLLVAAAVATAYTLLGGMWSVTATDAVQVVLLLFGLAVLALAVFGRLGDGDVLAGVLTLHARTPADRLRVAPAQIHALLPWLGVLAAGALGNLPGQDLAQRLFAARDGRTAARACYLGGLAYLTIGFVPALIALAAALLSPDQPPTRATLPLLAGLLLSPLLSAVFVVTVLSAVLSTVTAAILAPASVLAENLAPAAWRERLGELRLVRGAVVVVALASLLAAFLGESAFALLESAYEIGMVGLLVPLLCGLRGQRGDEVAALAAMGAGTALWLAHRGLGWTVFLRPLWPPPAAESAGVPTGLGCTALSFMVWLALARRPGGAGPSR